MTVNGMTIQLTARQSRALETEDGGAPRAVDVRSNVTYVLVREQEYDALREILDDEQRQQAIRRTALRNAEGRMAESA